MQAPVGGGLLQGKHSGCRAWANKVGRKPYFGPMQGCPLPVIHLLWTPWLQMYIQAYKSNNLRLKIVKNDFPEHPLWLEGALTRSSHYQQYQPVVTLQHGYTIHWDQPAPTELAIWLINFNK